MKVKLQDVVDEDQALGFDLEDDEDEGLDDDPECLQEVRQKAREIDESADWIQLPTQRDVHEYHLMEQFGSALENAEPRNKILQTIRGRGTFRRFKQVLDDLSLWDEWTSFKRAELERIAIEFLQENRIEYSRST